MGFIRRYRHGFDDLCGSVCGRRRVQTPAHSQTTQGQAQHTGGAGADDADTSPLPLTIVLAFDGTNLIGTCCMETFTIRDLRERTGELVRGAEEGKLSIVTKHGQGVFVAMPFDEAMLRSGVRVALAVKLFDEEAVSLGKAAKLAGVSQSEFINHLGALKIPLARYGADELAQEVAGFA